MNNIKIDFASITNTNPKDNVFELRQQIYKNLINKIYEHIDSLYVRLANDTKIEDIKRRSIRNRINRESTMMMYKGVEIPMMDKTCLILDNIEYIPIFQMVDKPIHLQKDGKYMVIKNNVRNTFLKLDGSICCALYKNGTIPLLPYLLYIYNTVEEMLTDLGYKIIHNPEGLDLDSGNYYIVPEYNAHTYLIVEKNFSSDGWKHYFLSPYTKENFDFHQTVCNTIIDNINNNIIPQVTTNDKDGNVIVLDDDSMTDVINSSVIDDRLAQAKIARENLENRNIRENLLIPHKKNQDALDKIFNIINVYHMHTKTIKKALTKMYLETTLFKYTCEDITMDNASIYGLVTGAIREDKPISKYYDITDISQKDMRFMEWYAIKLSSVRSYPEQNLITEVAKTEQKRVYNNSVNPITELAMMSRVNMFGKGALPKESCQSNIRNLHDSYMGIIDPIASPAGVNIGISLHVTPEVTSLDLYKESARLKEDNIFLKLYREQEGEDSLYDGEEGHTVVDRGDA